MRRVSCSHPSACPALDEDGFITGSGFDVNPKSLGYSTCTYVGLNLERGNMYKKVVERLQNIPEIVECHFTTGSYTMLLKLYARDNEQLMDLLNNKLQAIPGVVSTETLISLEQSIKREVPVLLEEDVIFCYLEINKWKHLTWSRISRVRTLLFPKRCISP